MRPLLTATGALLKLSWPLVITYSLQAVVGFTDAWFAGRLGAQALAGLGAQTFLNLALFVLLGGVAFAVQVPVATACGAGRPGDAPAWLSAGLVASLLTLPLFAAAAAAGPALFSLFGLPPDSAGYAVAYWQPRMLGGVAVVALFAVTSHLAGLGRTGASLCANLVAAVANVPLNEWLIFEQGLGLPGSAHASTLASALGAGVGWLLALRSGRWHALPLPRWMDVRALLAAGVPIGLSAAADVLGFAVFQLMMSRLGAAEGAATLLLLSMTGLAFWPALGVAVGSTTLIASHVGARRLAQLHDTVRATLLLMAGWMLAAGAAMFAFGPAVMAALLGGASGDAGAVLAVATPLLGIVAAYQVFDAINLGSAFSLRGLGDVKWASVVGTVCTFALFLPLAAWLSFGALGWGVRGGWIAAALFSVLLAVAFHLRLAGRLRHFHQAPAC